jgi:hypothetical protein
VIIGFSGKRGVGKTLAADYLVKKYQFDKVSFADKLKEDAKVFFPFTAAQLYGDAKEKPFNQYDWTPREFLIKLGQFMRYWDDMYWIKSSLAAGVKKYRNIVIDDLRFKNEANFLKAGYAKLIRIERYKSHNPYKTELHDVSETDLDEYKDFDFQINEVHNRSSVGLEERLDEIMESIGVEKI